MRSAYGGHDQLGWKSRTCQRLQTASPVLHAFELPQLRQARVKDLALFLSDKASQGLIKQTRLRHTQQDDGSSVSFLDNAVGVSDQVAVWGKFA
jgi:hypothetical protein